MANLSPAPKLQFFDANGNPLAGGKLYTYAAGTTTPLATYTDAGGGTPNANPVILDSRGEANIWLGSASYKFKLTTFADVEVWTVDNVQSDSAVVLAALAASSGSSLVGFIQSGAGSTARTVQTKLRDAISVKDFGAVGNGVADDTTAIQNALNYLATVGFSGYQGATLYFPPGKYLISSTLKPAMASGLANIRLIGAGQTNTIIEWNGSTDATKAMFGLYAADSGSMAGSLIEGIRFKGKGKVGYCVLFETTSTSTGAARRENENNVFRQCWFDGTLRAAVMFGAYSIDTYAAYVSAGNDINVDGTTFDNCTFLNFENYAFKQVGSNIYNTIFRNCFMWSGNSTDVTSTNAKNYIFSVAAGMTIVEGGIFQALISTGANDGTDKIACLRGAFADFHVFGAQSEDARIIYHNNEGDPTRPQYLNGIYVNDSRAINDGEWAIYNESSSPINVSSCSFGHLSGSDNYRYVYSVGALHWSDSVTAKTTATKMVIGTASFAQSTFNSRPFDRSRPINDGWAVDSWEVPAATYRNATTIDYYLNGFYKAFGTGAQGTLQQVSSALYNRVVPRLECTVVGSTYGLRFSMRDKFDVKPYRGNSVWVLVAGQHDGTFTTNTQLPIQMFTDSSGGTSSGVLFQDGNLFVSYYKQEISSTATYIQAELNVKQVGYVDLINFLVVPDEYGMQAGAFAIAQYTRGNTVKLPALFEANGLSEAFQSATQTYTDTLTTYENVMYLVGANHNDGGAETAIILAHRIGSTAYVSKVSSLNSGTGASITASASGADVTISIDGTSLAYVKKLKIADA